MKKRQQLLGFCYALLFGILNVPGVFAEEKPSFISSSEDHFATGDFQVSSRSLPLHSLEDAVREIILPEYSENNFHPGIFYHPKNNLFSEKIAERRATSKGPERDLKQIIRIQLFPFHFFL
ncbi:hypothetical protein [Salinimicrobium sp. GXAS 041]|uniref:hypothetical protein n=1 Tax=Salinimicrobium sp. GXAS 041 TaxID=3400806 RepID=UPI003C747B42